MHSSSIHSPGHPGTGPLVSTEPVLDYPRPSPDSAWHAQSAAALCETFTVAPGQGLSGTDAAARLSDYGLNQLVEPPARPLWRRFLEQFQSGLVIILGVAALLAGLIGDFKNALAIVVVILLNAALGFAQERRAEHALAALGRMLAPTARVRRDGATQVVAANTLVPGDIILLEAGDRVPADARILQAHDAQAAEAALSGESQPSEKTADTVAADAALAERHCLVFMNTMITRGRIEAVVVATGMQTEMGRVAGLLAQTRDAATPLQRQLDTLGRRLALLTSAIVGLIFIAGLLRGDDVISTAMTAIALAVAAIPEGLPAVVTVTLALGMHRMARRHVIVRKMAAVETLGCTTVICSDKTGTLTLNRMTARRMLVHGQILDLSGEDLTPGLRPALLPAALCADARLDRNGGVIGDPTEGALLALAMRAGIDVDAENARTPRLAELPFDATRRLMATFHADGDAVQIWIKGAPDALAGHATRILEAGGLHAMDSERRDALLTANQNLAAEGMRVLALAGRRIPAASFDTTTDLLSWMDALDMLALVAIMDPPRPEARASIAQCQAAGIQVKMITGDHPVTAAAIARELGLVGEVHEGRALDGLDDAALAALVERSAVLARVAPEHKLRIVQALQSRGHVVAMTGDGVNDAPALRHADIGVAMGINGTEVSRQAASMVLADDNFASIVGAVREGRKLYENIIKFVRFQLSTNIGALLAVAGAPLIGLGSPFTPVQILWVNIIMDGPPAMTLALEQARPGIMQEPPRSSGDAILNNRRLGQITLTGLAMALGTLGIFAWAMAGGNARYAGTMAFTTFVLFQFFNLFNVRSAGHTVFSRRFFSNGKLWLALASVIALQILAVHWGPAQAIFDTTTLTYSDWGLASAVASSALILEEARKWLARRLQKTRGR